MTDKLKIRVRERMMRTGESYVTALRATLAQRPGCKGCGRRKCTCGVRMNLIQWLFFDLPCLLLHKAHHEKKLAFTYCRKCRAYR